MFIHRKKLEWIGPSYREFQELPAQARRAAGYQLDRVQDGVEPDDWKPMESIGPGVCELRLRTYEGGWVQHRVIYVARFPEAVHVLHAFQKKTQATSRHNLDVARARYRQMIRERE